MFLKQFLIYAKLLTECLRPFIGLPVIYQRLISLRPCESWMPSFISSSSFKVQNAFWESLLFVSRGRMTVKWMMRCHGSGPGDPTRMSGLGHVPSSHPASLATSSLPQEVQRSGEGIWSKQEVMASYADAAHFHSSHLRHFFFRVSELRRQFYLLRLQRVLVWNTDFCSPPSPALL